MTDTPVQYWPDFPVPKNVPSAFEFEGALDVYEFARLVFPRIMEFVERPDYPTLSSDEVGEFLEAQVKEMVRG